MADTTTSWSGQHGRTYTFRTYDLHRLFRESARPDLPAESGVYIFSRGVQSRLFAIYIGETGDLDDRLNTRWSSHHKKVCIEGYHPTQLHIYPVAEGARETIESDLVEAQRPVCNDL